MGKRLPKKLLLEEIEFEKKRLDEVLASLTVDRMNMPGVTPGGWSVKDVLAHLIGWQRMIISFQEAEERGETPEVPGYGLTWRQTPELNEIIYRQHHDRPLQDILQDFASSHGSMLQLIDRMPESSLVEVGRFTWAGPSWCLSDYVRAETASHYRWAFNHIRRWLRQSDR